VGCGFPENALPECLLAITGASPRQNLAWNAPRAFQWASQTWNMMRRALSLVASRNQSMAPDQGTTELIFGIVFASIIKATQKCFCIK
jgi:hypothetical protein